MIPVPFSPAVRVLECPRCGAPLEGVGEAVRCRFCGAVSVVGPRDDRALVAHGDAFADERARMLAQRPGPPLPGYGPYSLSPNPAGFEGTEGKPYAELAPRLLQAWEAIRAEFAAEHKVRDEYRAYWVALVLDTWYASEQDEARRRAMLESALEMLPGSGCRHILRCHMANAAARALDFASADAWLASCDPHADDEDLASNYRLSASTIADRRHEYARVLELLGPTLAQAPNATMRRSINCAEARVSALEDLGRVNEALAELKMSIAELGPGVVAALLRTKRAPQAMARYRRSSKGFVIGAVVIASVAATLVVWRTC
jgi:hypothetical protein